MTKEPFLTVDDLFEGDDIVIKSVLFERGKALGLDDITVHLMLQKAVDDGKIQQVDYETRQGEIFFEMDKLPY